MRPKLKDIAKTYDCVVAAVTQTGEVPFEVWNDPTRVLTRSNTEGDRTLIKPFSFVLTGNVTIEESKQNYFVSFVINCVTTRMMVLLFVFLRILRMAFSTTWAGHQPLNRYWICRHLKS